MSHYSLSNPSLHLFLLEINFIFLFNPHAVTFHIQHCRSFHACLPTYPFTLLSITQSYKHSDACCMCFSLGASKCRELFWKIKVLVEVLTLKSLRPLKSKIYFFKFNIFCLKFSQFIETLFYFYTDKLLPHFFTIVFVPYKCVAIEHNSKCVLLCSHEK